MRNSEFSRLRNLLQGVTAFMATGLVSTAVLAQSVYTPSEPECVKLTQEQAQTAFARLKARLPSTSFDYAQPSEVCGMVRVQLQSGKVVYTEPTGRYMLLAFALDTHKGSPADVSSDLEEEIEHRQAFPSTAIPGLFPQD